MIKVLFFTLLTTSFAFADEMPVEYSLKDRGFTNCNSGPSFFEKAECGREYAQVFVCDKAYTTGSVRVTVLGIGKIKSDVQGECQPIRVYDKFIEERTF